MYWYKPLLFLTFKKGYQLDKQFVLLLWHSFIFTLCYYYVKMENKHLPIYLSSIKTPSTTTNDNKTQLKKQV